MIKLKSNEKICPRCRGHKKMFKIMGGYSAVNSGGKEVDCICCLGSGAIKTLEGAIAELEKPRIPESIPPPVLSEPIKKRGRPKRESLNSEL